MYTFSSYERHHQHALLNLLFFATRPHQHMDWHTPEQWLNTERHVTQLAWQGNKLMGVISASEPCEGISWVRLIAFDSSVGASELLRAMWQPFIIQLEAQNCQTVALMIVDDWITRYMSALGFVYQEDVVTLNRFRQPRTPLLTGGIKIEVVEEEDLNAIYQVDYSAFAPLWRLAHADIRQAWRIASICTLARLNDEIVGYQLSTLSQQFAHLARLAVKPVHQGKGIGKVLVQDMIERFQKRGIQTISVNTQNSNQHSQRLYIQLGFKRNGYDIPVWLADIKGGL